MEERKLEFLNEEDVANFVTEVIRNQQHQGSLDEFIKRAVHGAFEMDRALATSRRLRTST